MIGKYIWAVLICLILSAVNAGAEDATTRREIEQLEQRIETLEKKQHETAASESGESSGTNGMISIGGVISGVYQYEWVSGPSDPEDRGRGAFSFQPEVSLTPTDADEFFFLLGFGAGNGLAGVTAFNLAPWAAGVEDDVKNINGRNRDYLLQAWYKHTFTFSEDHRLALVGGLIDATDYLDDNAYANDEYTQFMNEALVNGPNAFLPSWDFGTAAVWDIGPFGIRGVYMNIGENEDGNNFNFYGFQLNYTLETPIGEGHYRVNYNFTSEAFLSPASTEEKCQCVLLSFDQALGDIFGAWIRFGFQADDALITYDTLYSGGINISGRLWGREQDNIGIAYAHLNGAEQTSDSISSSQAAEAYVNFGLNDYLCLTVDLQYMDDRYVPAADANDVDGWIAGARMTAEF
jgi:porin